MEEVETSQLITNLTESDSCDSLPYWVRRPAPEPLASMTKSESMLFLPVHELGNVQPHLLLGKPDELYAEALRRELHQFPGLAPPPLAPPHDVLLHHVPAAELRNPQCDDRPSVADRALTNWRRLLRRRCRQSRLLADRTGRPPGALCMYSGGDFQLRASRVLRTTLAHGPPAARPTGEGFWRLASRFGGELHGLQETLPEELSHQRRRVEQRVQVPSVIRAERGTAPLADGETGARAGPYHRACRPASPPAEDDLVVVGHAVCRGAASPPPAADRRPRSPSVDSDGDSSLSDVSRHGPRLLLAGQEAVFRPGNSHRTEPAVSAAVSLCCAAGQLCRRYVPLAAAGPVAIHYRWRAVPGARHFTSRPPTPVFFFDSGPGVLLPGAVLRLSVVFFAAGAGLYSEAWDLVTEPRLEAGVPVRLHLHGLAGLQDPYGPDRARLQAGLERGVAHAAATAILHLLVRNATLSEEVPPAPQPDNTLATHFNSSNPGLQYRAVEVQQLMQLHAEVAEASQPHAEAADARQPADRRRVDRRGRRHGRPLQPPSAPEPWDLSCAQLKADILALDGGAARGELLTRLHGLAERLWRPTDWPAPASAATVVRSGLVIVIQRFSALAAELEVRLGVTRGDTAPETAEPPSSAVPQQPPRRSRGASGGRSGKKRSAKKPSSGDSRGRSHTPSVQPSKSSHNVLDGEPVVTVAATTVPTVAPAVQARLRRSLYAIMRSLLSDFLEDITEPLEAVAKPPDEFLITDSMCGSQYR